MSNFLVRPATINDHQQLSNLIFFETRLHRHLDWRTPLEWLGASFYWVLEQDGQVTAALACPLEVDGIAWVRLFVYAGRWQAQDAWNLLWNFAQAEMARVGGAKAAVISMQNWFQPILVEYGFKNLQDIVMLEWQYQPWAWREADGVRIRRMEPGDLPQVQKTDEAAFSPLWQNSLETMRKAYAQALIATVAETSDGIVGYQLSTGGHGRAHLARLAVQPSLQGRGVGRSLVGDLFDHLGRFGIPRLTVNTQSDNSISLGLYKKMGFLRTGEQYPVYTFDVPSL